MMLTKEHITGILINILDCTYGPNVPGSDETMLADYSLDQSVIPDFIYEIENALSLSIYHDLYDMIFSAGWTHLSIDDLAYQIYELVESP